MTGLAMLASLTIRAGRPLMAGPASCGAQIRLQVCVFNSSGWRLACAKMLKYEINFLELGRKVRTHRVAADVSAVLFSPPYR